MSLRFDINFKKIGILILSFLIIVPLLSRAQTIKTLSTNDTTYTYTDSSFELLNAASEGDTTKLQAFLKIGTSANTTTWDGISPLMYAAQNGHLSAVLMLLHHGANVNSKPFSQLDALTGACIAGHALIVDTLILNGADVESKNTDGLTPLMWAAAYNHELVADILIFYKANVNAVDVFGNSPLHYSCFYDCPEVTNLLLEHGANQEAADIKGFTPLMLAAQNGHIQNIDILIRHGANLNKRNNKQLNPLALATINNQEASVQFLLLQGADPDIAVGKKLNLYDMAILSRAKNIAMIYDSIGLHPNKKLLIHQWGIHTFVDGNAKDLMLGLSFSLSEAKHGLRMETAYRTRPAVRSVRYEKGDHLYYQFWERRSLIHWAIYKNFTLLPMNFQQSLNAYAGLGIAYTWGNFRGSSKKPADHLLLIPTAGLDYQYHAFSLKLFYEFLKLANSKIPASHLGLSIGVNFNVFKKQLQLKKEPIF